MEIWALLQLKFIINGWQKAEACELFMQINGSRKKCGWTLNNPFKVHFLVSNRVNQIYQCTGFSGFDWQYVEASIFQNDKKSEREREKEDADENFCEKLILQFYLQLDICVVRRCF